MKEIENYDVAHLHREKGKFGDFPAAAKALQSCLTLLNPTDGSPPGSSVPGILQARTLEWVAISFSLVGQWLRLHTSNAGAWVRSLIGEIRSHMPDGTAGGKKERNPMVKSKFWEFWRSLEVLGNQVPWVLTLIAH